MAKLGAMIFLLTFLAGAQTAATSTVPDSTADTVQKLNPQQPVPLRPAKPGEQVGESAADSRAKKNPALYPIDKLPVSDSLRIPVLDFENADVRDVLRGIGMQYNVNIFLEPEVTGAISLYLSDISVRNAIDFIVKRSNYAYTVENGIVKVYKYKEPPPPPPEKPPVTFSLENGKLEVDLKDVPVAQVARFFSDSAGINVVVEAGTEATVSSRLVGMPVEKALKAIVESSNLSLTNRDGIFYIGKPSWGNDAGGTGAATGGGGLKRLSLTIKEGLVTIEVDNAALDQVVRTIAVQSGINIVIYDHLTGEISAKMSQTPIDDALRFLLQNTKFTFWKEKNIYFIGSREMNQQKTTVIIPLRHIMAEEAGISKILPPSISTNAVVKYNSEHNSIIIIGSSDIVAQAQEFIDKIDKPVPQVLIEALVVDFNVNKIRDYGMSLFTQGYNDTSRSWLSEEFLPTLNLKPGRNRTTRILGEVLKSIGIDQIVDLPQNFRAAIRALESADIVRVHSTPQIATINGNSASITIGETRYYRLQKETKAPVENNNAIIGTDERFEVIKFNTQLEVTPWVMDEGYVMVKIRPEFNIPRTGGDAGTPPNVDTRVIESMVRLRNGQTIVLGGQRQTENVVNSKGVPFLSSIPILGWLFSSRTVTKNETQMMIFLTPHVYYGDDNAVSPDDYFGKEVNKIIDKYDIDKKKEAKKERNQRRHFFRKRKATADKPDTTVESGKDSVGAPQGTRDAKVSAASGKKMVIGAGKVNDATTAAAEEHVTKPEADSTEAGKARQKRRWRLFSREKKKSE
jgi:type II secretory pathway component GspD/PulD (secretin)